MSWLYFIREGDTGPVKIGRATDPWKRLDALQTGNPRQLRIIAARRVGKSVHIAERNAHREFAAHRLSGEWYSPVDRVIEAARALGCPGCERCQVGAERLHVWSPMYGVPDVALCFACLNHEQTEKIKAQEEREQRERLQRMERH